MPSETHDPAAAYIVECGVLRASSQNDDWIAAFKSDLVTFLVALARHSGGLIGTSNISQAGASLSLHSPVSTDFKMVCDIPVGSDPTIYLSWTTPGASHRYNLVTNFDTSSRYPIYWAIYKGVSDIGVTLARDERSRLPSSVSSYTPPTDEEWRTIKDNLCYFTPCSFYIVSALDSLRNRDGYTGVMITSGIRTNLQIRWTANANLETGRYINTTSSAPGVKQYYDPDNAPQTQQDIALLGVTLLCGDTCYYPANSNVSPLTPTVTSSTAPIDHVGPAWHPTSACIATSMKTVYWGHTIPKNSYSSVPQLARVGPELLTHGSGSDAQLFLRSYEAYMPVAAQEEE